MRISPVNLSPAEALSKAKSKIAVRNEERRAAQDASPEEIEEELPSSPGSIDAGRAQRLLERAASLAGRGDMGAAILAARQSLALAPDNAEAHLLHARLLERNRDFGGARAAYEKSVQLAPDRADARENLARLTTYLDQSSSAARQFHFDSDELFAPSAESNAPGNANADQAKSAPATAASATPAPAATAGAVTVIAAAPPKPQASSEVDITSLLDESMLPSVEARLPPTRSEIAAVAVAEKGAQASGQSELVARAESANAAPAGDRRKHNTPVATERRRRPATGAVAALAASAVAPAVAAAAAPKTAPVPLRPAPLRAAPATPAPAAANQLGLGVSGGNAQTVRAPLALDIPAASAAPLWQQVISRPSFYARTLPLVGVALLSLGFLSWARDRAVSQVAAPAPTELASADFAPDAPDAPDSPATVPGTTLPVPDNSGQTTDSTPGAVPARDASGFPISNAPFVFQAPPAQNASAPDTTEAPDAPASSSAPSRSSGGNSGRPNGRGNSAPSTTARASNRGSNSRTGALPMRVLPPARSVPRFPSVALAPAPIPPASVRSTIPRAPRGDNGSNIILPSPNIAMPQAAPARQRVLPPTDSGLNPAGSPGRGYVRVTEGRVGNGVIPSQPSAVARDNERAANEAARQGQNDQAISQLSQAIRADSDNAGFRYQQRAMLFLQRGDYNRASDDFQSAISAYQSQINKGDDVAGAKRGLSSARSGLSLALAGRRG